jgi:hypothetical protein
MYKSQLGFDFSISQPLEHVPDAPYYPSVTLRLAGWQVASGVRSMISAPLRTTAEIDTFVAGLKAELDTLAERSKLALAHEIEKSRR